MCENIFKSGHSATSFTTNVPRQLTLAEKATLVRFAEEYNPSGTSISFSMGIKCKPRNKKYCVIRIATDSSHITKKLAQKLQVITKHFDDEYDSDDYWVDSTPMTLELCKFFIRAEKSARKLGKRLQPHQGHTALA